MSLRDVWTTATFFGTFRGHTEGVDVEAVLGVSMTPSTVGLVLVEGREADGATIHHDAFDIRGHSAARTDEICDEIVAAVRRTEEVATERARQLTTIGVTCSSGASAEAAVLLRKLAEAGFADVVPVRLPQATEALARRVAGIVGFATTGVCVLEPDVVQAMTVGGHKPVRTTVSRGIETVAGLTEWLSGMFDAAEPRPDALVVVGSAVDLDSVLPKLEQALKVRVFTPAEPGLPLARGAALASVRRGRLPLDDGASPTGWRWPAKQLTPLAILVGGVLAFAVSLSVAIGQQLAPGHESTPHRTSRPVVSTSGDSAPVHPATPQIAIPVPAPPVPQTQQVQQTAEPANVVDQSRTAPSEDTGLSSAPAEPTTTAPDPVPPETQSPEHPATPTPDPGQQPAPLPQALPTPQPENAAPVAPPPPAPEPVPGPPPTPDPALPATPDPGPPAPEAAPVTPEPVSAAPPPVPEQQAPVPAAP